MTAEQLQQIFGRRITECRKAKGWSQAELARQLGTTSGGVCDYEKARYGATLATVVKFANALEVAPADLLLENAVPKKTQKSGLTPYSSLSKFCVVNKRHPLKPPTGRRI